MEKVSEETLEEKRNIKVVKGDKERMVNKQELSTYKQMGWEVVKEAIDPVDPKAVKKKFTDRKDKDIDNDGDTDSSDEYLHKRRKAISKALANEEKKLEKDSDDPCWKDYVQLGTKKKNGKEVPNCVPKEEVELDEAQKELTPKAVEDHLVKKGVNPKDAKAAVKKGFGYANKKYGGATYAAALKKVAEVVWTLHEAKETLDELEEAKSDYTIYHKTFSSAVQHAAEVVKKRGYEVDEDDWDRKVAMGPRKPSKGKTNSYSIALMKGDKPAKQKLQMQVYYDEGRYELNMYIS
jgi:hypothetical protein